MCPEAWKPCPLSSKPLNPEAPEWSPQSSLPSGLSPPPKLQLVAYTAGAQLPKRHCYHTLSSHCFIPHEAVAPHIVFCNKPPWTRFRPRWYFEYRGMASVPVHEMGSEIQVNGDEEVHWKSSWRGSNRHSDKEKMKCIRRTPNFPPRILTAKRANAMEYKEKKKKKKKKHKKMERRKGKSRKTKYEERLTEDSSVSGDKTTVMIKNIPNQFRRDDVLKFLDQRCKVYSFEYDFFYLPMDFRSKDNLGYAFVNFTTAVAARKMMEILQNHRWGTIQTYKGMRFSHKICEAKWARIQGKEDLVGRFQHSNFCCDQLDFLPVLFDPPRNGFDPNQVPVIVGKLSNQNIVLC